MRSAILALLLPPFFLRSFSDVSFSRSLQEGHDIGHIPRLSLLEGHVIGSIPKLFLQEGHVIDYRQYPSSMPTVKLCHRQPSSLPTGKLCNIQ